MSALRRTPQEHQPACSSIEVADDAVKVGKVRDLPAISLGPAQAVERAETDLRLSLFLGERAIDALPCLGERLLLDAPRLLVVEFVEPFSPVLPGTLRELLKVSLEFGAKGLPGFSSRAE